MATLVDALLSLRPGAEWHLKGNSISDLVWLDQTQVKPTDQELSAEVARLSSLPVDPVSHFDLISLQIAFNYENRIRVLENKAPISMAQFKAAVRTLLT